MLHLGRATTAEALAPGTGCGYLTAEKPYQWRKGVVLAFAPSPGRGYAVRDAVSRLEVKDLPPQRVMTPFAAPVARPAVPWWRTN